MKETIGDIKKREPNYTHEQIRERLELAIEIKKIKKVHENNKAIDIIKSLIEQKKEENKGITRMIKQLEKLRIS